jgi:hypothetical protein
LAAARVEAEAAKAAAAAAEESRRAAEAAADKLKEAERERLRKVSNSSHFKISVMYFDFVSTNLMQI